MQWTWYAVPALIGGGIALGLTIYASQQRQRTAAWSLGLLSLAIAIWCLGYAGELVAAGLAAKVWFARLEYVGIGSVPLLWVLYGMDYAGLRRLHGWLLVAALALPITTIALVWTNAWHHWIWTRMMLVEVGGAQMLELDHGPGFWLYIAYSYVALLIGSGLVLRTTTRSPQWYRHHGLIMICAAVAPWIGNVLYVSKLTPFPSLDLTPFGFALSMSLVWWANRQVQLLEVVPVVRSQVIDALREAVVVIDAQLRIVDVNPCACEWFGLDQQRCIGTSVKPLLERWHISAALLHQPSDQPLLVHSADGRWYELLTSGYRNQYGVNIGQIIIMRDDTERQRAEQTVRRHALTFENMLDSVMLTNDAGHIIDCNAATERIYGYARSAIIGRMLLSWLPISAEEQATIRSDVRAALAQAGRWSGEVAFRRPDGARGMAEAVVVPLSGDSAQAATLIVISRDITARLAAQAELLQQKRWFESLVAVARATAAAPDLDTTLQNALRVAVELTAAERGSIFLLDDAGKPISSILVRPDISALEHSTLVTQVFDQGLAGWVARHGQMALIENTAADERWLELPNSPYHARSVLALPIINAEQLLGVLVLLHGDVGHFSSEHSQLMQAAVAQMALSMRNAQIYAAQRTLAEQLRAARDTAEAANRAKTQFLATMSHELRTPLNAVLGYSDILLEEFRERELDELQVDVEQIQAAGHNLLGLVNDVLDLAQAEVGTMQVYWEYTDVRMLVERVAESARVQLEQNNNRLALHVNVPEPFWLTDATKVRRILSNLIGNAAKFTQSGVVTLDVTRIDTPEPTMVFVVQDTGIGMTSVQVQRMFEPFNQADSSSTRRYGGFGVGLALARKFVDILGGSIAVTSAEQVGTTIEVRLPIVSPNTAANLLEQQMSAS